MRILSCDSCPIRMFLRGQFYFEEWSPEVSLLLLSMVLLDQLAGLHFPQTMSALGKV